MLRARRPSKCGAATTGSRSRRSRAQVGNYYSNSIYSGYVSASEGEEETQPESQPQSKPTGHSSRSVVPPTPKKAGKKRNFVSFMTLKESALHAMDFSKLQDIPNLPRTVPYSPQTKHSSYARQFRNKRHVSLLHVSFSEDEISAIIGLLSPSGVDPRLSEMSQADQVIHIAQSVHNSRLEQVLRQKLPQMFQLQNLLNSQKFDNLIAYHQAAESADPLIDNLCNEMLSKKSTVAQTSQLLSLAGTP